MSEEAQNEQQTEGEDAPKKGGKMMLIVGLLAAMMSGGAGFVLPKMMPSLFGAAPEEPIPDEPEIVAKPKDLGFVEFGEIIVNLNMDRFNRYLKVKLTLEVAKDKVAEMESLVDKRKALLRGWLLGHLADKTMEEIRGAAGQNQLRREIHNQFNSILSDTGKDVVTDVYFDEFNVQ